LLCDIEFEMLVFVEEGELEEEKYPRSKDKNKLEPHMALIKLRQHWWKWTLLLPVRH